MGDKSIPKLRFPEFTDEWEQRKLGEIVDFLDDKRKPIEENVRIAGVYPYYGASGVIDYVDGYLFDEELVLLSEDGANIVDRNYRVSFIASGKYWVNNHAHVLKAKLNFYNAFICEALERLNFEQYNTGTAQPKLNQEVCRNIRIFFPNFDEQKKIAEFHKTLDHLITLHQRKCYCLKKLRDGIIQKILSRELRFKRADGREFENWVTKELWEILTERKVSQTITEDAPLLSFTIEQGVIKPQDKKTNKRDFLIKDKETKKFALTEVDDIIYNPANLKYGAIHRNKLMRGVVSPIYAIFYTEQNPAFMEYVVKNPIFIKNSMKYLEGTVIMQIPVERYTYSEINGIVIPI